MNYGRHTSALLLLLVPLGGMASDDPLEFAPEFEFRDQKLAGMAVRMELRNFFLDAENTKSSREIAELKRPMYSHIWKKQRQYFEMEESQYLRSHDITDHIVMIKAAPDKKIVFNATVDPYVQEVKMKFAPIEELKSIQEVAQEKIFNRMARMGFYPPSFSSGGHVNIKLTGFGADLEEQLRTALNFITDFANHDLGAGTFLYDPHNARPLRETKALAHEMDLEIRRIQTMIDKGDFENAQKIMEDVFSKFKEVAFKGGHVEVRAVRAQKSFKEFIDYAEIFEARIKKLRKLSSKKEAWISLSKTPISVGMANEKMFNRYVSEAGVDPKKYQHLVRNAYNLSNGAMCMYKITNAMFVSPARRGLGKIKIWFGSR